MTDSPQPRIVLGEWFDIREFFKLFWHFDWIRSQREPKWETNGTQTVLIEVSKIVRRNWTMRKQEAGFQPSKYLLHLTTLMLDLTPRSLIESRRNVTPSDVNPITTLVSLPNSPIRLPNVGEKASPDRSKNHLSESRCLLGLKTPVG